jgi:hypothetical protein
MTKEGIKMNLNAPSVYYSFPLFSSKNDPFAIVNQAMLVDTA